MMATNVVTRFGGGSFTSVGIAPELLTDGTSQDVTVASVSQSVMEAERVDRIDSRTETTSRFDFAVEGALSFAESNDDVPRTIVVVPDGEAVLRIDVNASGPGCPAAAERIYEEIVSSFEPI